MTKAGYKFYFTNIVQIQAGWYHDTPALRATPLTRGKPGPRRYDGAFLGGAASAGFVDKNETVVTLAPGCG